ncbi:alpha/beta fold hydrolase [Catellatospora tritici]|uniref:alpha/beta fold hydrolase n=1 Tax=Catellatospora tritici TaxID=2851566 RepID=UPI001C2D2390|nr:alpha/beta hydrolase [Catellatospora tritici]MBV1853779.1 alpha/beta hydrolase [Catellatospora tritici]
MRDAQVLPDGSRIRWVELPGTDPARVFLHGLGATSAPYFLNTATHPALAGHRTLLMDMLGFGVSDRPADFGYTLEEHADVLAAALTQAAATGAEVIAHSMGGAVAIVLAARHPHLVAKLVLVDANLDPSTPARRPGSSGIATYTEPEFLAHGWDETLERVGPHWAATMRLAGREALHRSAVHLARATVPTMREQLRSLAIPRTYLHPAGAEPGGVAQLTQAGVRLVAIPDTGHNIMLDNPDRFAHEVADALGVTTGA